jgi:hypothetical protein
MPNQTMWKGAIAVVVVLIAYKYIAPKVGLPAI